MTKSTVEVLKEKAKLGKCLACALVGPDLDIYEIYVSDKSVSKAQYYVNGVLVPRDVYLAALQTSHFDRYDANDPNIISRVTKVNISDSDNEEDEDVEPEGASKIKDDMLS